MAKRFNWQIQIEIEKIFEKLPEYNLLCGKSYMENRGEGQLEQKQQLSISYLSWEHDLILSKSLIFGICPTSNNFDYKQTFLCHSIS
jgi:hypothetical protein